jgi:hypothetical protein
VTVKVAECRAISEKPRSLLKAIENLPRHEIVLCTDGYDVLYLSGEQDIREAFLSLRSPVVFSGERASVHHLLSTEKYLKGRFGVAPYPFLNSGLIMGEVGYLIDMLEYINNSSFQRVKRKFEEDSKSGFRGHFNDQTLFGEYAATHPHIAKPDWNASLFWTAARECQSFDEIFQIHNGRVKNRYSGTSPAVIHVPYIKRYYPTYLFVASQIGIKIRSSNCHLDSWEASVNEKMISIDPTINALVTSLLLFRGRRLLRKTRKGLSKRRIRLGQIRRKFFGYPFKKSQ